MLGPSQKISNSFPEAHSSPPEGFAVRGSGEAANSTPRPNPEQLRQILNSPEGQALLRLLQADGGAGLRSAAEALRQGDGAGVRAALSPLLAGTKAEELTRKLEAKL